MIRQLHRFSFCAVILASCSFSSFAQETQETAEMLPKQCNAEVARSLVEQQIAGGKTVEDTAKRINIFLRGADFLWQIDEPAARKHFTDAFDLARERFKEKGFDEKRTVRGTMTFSTGRKDFRTEVLTAIAKRDSAWARKLTETLLQDIAEARKGENFNPSNNFNGEVASLLGIASSLLDVNKQSAMEFARRAARFPLTRENSSRWHTFLYQVAKEDQAAADALYAEVLTANSNTEVGYLLYLGGYPFGNPRVSGAGNMSMGAAVPTNFVPNVNLQKQYLNVLLRRTTSLQPETETPAAQQQSARRDLPEAAYALRALQDLEPVVAAKFADLMPRFFAAKTHVTSLVTAPNLAEMDKQRKQQERWNVSFDKKLENLENEKDPDKLDQLIVDLIVSAKTDEELNKVEAWVIKINEERVRESATNFVYFKRSEAAIEEKRIADAEKFAGKVAELEHRAVLYFKIAEAKLKQENDKLRGAEILDTVVQTALKAPNTVERAQVLLGSAFWYEKYDQYRAADVLSEAVKTINRLENPDLTASSVYRQIFGKGFGYVIGYSTPGYNLEKSFETVGKKDFQGALAQAGNLDDKSLRMLGVLAVVSDCANEEKREPKKPAQKAKTNNKTQN